MQQKFNEAQAKEQMEQVYRQITARENKDRATVEDQYGYVLEQAYQLAQKENRPLSEVLDSLTSSLAPETTSANRSRLQINDVYAILASDLLFIATPFIVTLGVFAYVGKLNQILSISEWAFAAALLTGQTITKLVSGILRDRTDMREPRVTFLITLTLTIGVMPSLLVLVLSLLEKEEFGTAGNMLPVWLIIAQFVVFGGAIIFYVLFGGLGEYLKMKQEPESTLQEEGISG